MIENGPISALRTLLVQARDRLDASLHPRRFTDAVGRLQAAEPSRVLFLCYGNVCRSPYAQWAFDARAPDGVSALSAGFFGPEREPPEDAIDAARARGVEHARHRSQLVTEAMLAGAEAHVIFDRFNARDLRRFGARADRVFWLGDFDPEWSGKRAIIDPWGRSPEFFAQTFARIDRCVATMSEALNSVGTRVEKS